MSNNDGCHVQTEAGKAAAWLQVCFSPPLLWRPWRPSAYNLIARIQRHSDFEWQALLCQATEIWDFICHQNQSFRQQQKYQKELTNNESKSLLLLFQLLISRAENYSPFHRTNLPVFKGCFSWVFSSPLTSLLDYYPISGVLSYFKLVKPWTQGR